jgi:hypothetical protein
MSPEYIELLGPKPAVVQYRCDRPLMWVDVESKRVKTLHFLQKNGRCVEV